MKLATICLILAYLVASGETANTKSIQLKKNNIGCAGVLETDAVSSRVSMFRYQYMPDDCDGNGSVHLLPFKKNGTEIVLTSEEVPSAANEVHDTLQMHKHFIPLRNFVQSKVKNTKDCVFFFRAADGIRNLETTVVDEVVKKMLGVLNLWNVTFFEENIEILTSKDEAVATWFTLNQVMGYSDIKLINTPALKIKKTPVPFGVVSDRGITLDQVFEIPEGVDIPEELQDNVENFDFCGLKKNLYVSSMPRMGRFAALDDLSIHFSETIPGRKKKLELGCFPDDCIFSVPDKDFTIIEDRAGGKFSYRADNVYGTSDYDLCQKQVSEAFEESFKAGKLPFKVPKKYEVFVTQEYSYLAENVLLKPTIFTPSDVVSKAKEICPLETKDSVSELLEPDANGETKNSACFGLVHMSNILKQSVGLDESFKINVAKNINNVRVLPAVGVTLMNLPEVLSKYAKFPEIIPTTTTTTPPKDEL